MPWLKYGYKVLEQEAENRYLNMTALCRMLNYQGTSEENIVFHQPVLSMIKAGQRGFTWKMIARVHKVLGIDLIHEESKRISADVPKRRKKKERGLFKIRKKHTLPDLRPESGTTPYE